VFGGRLDYARRNLQPRHAQCGNEIIRAQAANVVRAEQSLDAWRPQAVRSFLDRYSVSGSKDDRRDALLADSLRTGQPCFRRVSLDDPLVIQLRKLSRVDQELRRELSPPDIMESVAYRVHRLWD
jgi:hypothetical protein